MMDGIITGLNNKTGAVYAKVKEIANQIVKTLMDNLKVSSPSRVTISIFENVMLGMLVGMDNLKGKLYRFAEKIGDGITERLTISPDVSASMADRLRYVVDTNPFRQSSMSPAIGLAGGTGGVTYITNYNVSVVSPKPMSESELTRELKDMDRRLQFQLP